MSKMNNQYGTTLHDQGESGDMDIEMMMMMMMMKNGLGGRSSNSRRVTPLVLDDIEVVTAPPPSENEEEEEEERSDNTNNDTIEDWLPITESRNGNAFRAASHLFCSSIGIQTLLLPFAFVTLGWVWSILCLCVAFSWQLYTKCLLLLLHQSLPSTTRYSRYLHLSIAAFGLKLGKVLGMFPSMYLSGGACVLFTISGGSTLKLLYSSLCHHTHHCNYSITATHFFLIFIASAIILALFFHNLNSLACVSLVGSISALAYCTLLWTLSLHHHPHRHLHNSVVNTNNKSPAAGFRVVMNAIGIIFMGFRGHNLVLEIQGTLPSHPKRPSRKPMQRSIITASLLDAVCIFPLGIVGYWAYGNTIPGTAIERGILTAFTNFHQNAESSNSKYAVIPIIYILIIINYLCAFQICVMPVFDNLERIYITKKNRACPRLISCAIKVGFGGLACFMSICFPFLPSLGSFVGAIALPLTLVYPCLMWVAIKKPKRWSRMWWVNVGLGALGAVMCVMFGIAGLWSLIANGLKANFFRP